MATPARADLFLSCGEPSGDVYLARIAQALRERRPELRLAGVAGPESREAGVVPWAAQEDLAVMGFGEVIRHLPRLYRLGGELAARAVASGARLFLPVDYPGFHLRLAARVRRAGIPVLDFIPPKTWSWGRWRRRGIRRNVDRCAVIFPFEVEHYGEAGIEATFVGHPLADLHDRVLSVPADERSGLLLVPGSRRQEIERLLPHLVDALARLRADGFAGRVRVSRARSVDPLWLRPLEEAAPGEAVEIVEGALIEHLRGAEAAIVCSGTATVEAALAGTPHVIVYRTGGLSYAVARTLATVQHIGMANIVLGRRAFPELLQGGLRGETIASAVRPLFLGETPQRRAQLEACSELRSALGGPGAFDRVADLALSMLDASSPVAG